MELTGTYVATYIEYIILLYKRRKCMYAHVYKILMHELLWAPCILDAISGLNLGPIQRLRTVCKLPARIIAKFIL